MSNWQRFAVGGVAVVVVGALLAAVLGGRVGSGDDHGRVLKLEATRGGISERELGDLLMHRTRGGEIDYRVGDGRRATVHFERRGEAKRYGWLLVAPGVVTMRATPASPAALGLGDFDTGANYDPDTRRVIFGFSQRGQRRLRAFVRTARGHARSYVLEVDGRVVLRDTLAARIARERPDVAIGVAARFPGPARDGQELEAVLRSGPLRTPLRIVSD